MPHADKRFLALDFGQVLTLNQDLSCFDDFLVEADLDRANFVDAYYLKRPPYDRGSHNANTYWSEVLMECVAQKPSSSLNLASPQENAEKYLEWLCMADFLSWCRPRLAMQELTLKAIAAGVETALISNMPPIYGQKFIDTWPWLNKLKHCLFSSAIAHVKPEAAIYTHLLTSLQWTAEQTLLVDDRLENIEAALKLGFAVHHFVDEDQALAAITDWCGL